MAWLNNTLCFGIREDTMKNCPKKSSQTCKLYKGIIAGLIILVVTYILYLNSGLFYRKKIILPFSLHLNRQELYMVKGEEFRLFVYGINKRVSYHSTNIRVAGVDFTGRVFAYRTGKAFIIAKVDNKKLKCKVKVIDLNKKELNLKVGESYRLKIKGPLNFAKYKSSNSHVATVNMFGKVKAKKAGRTTIIVNVKGKTLKCTVRVK